MWLGKMSKLAVLALFILAGFSLPAFSADQPALPSAMADKVVVLKGERKLLLMNGDEVL